MADKTGKTKEVVFSHSVYKRVKITASQPKICFKKEQLHKYVRTICVVTLTNMMQLHFMSLGFKRGYSHHLTSQSLRQLGKELKRTLS